MRTRALLLLLLASCVSCGGGTAKIAVHLEAPRQSELDPYRAGGRLALVRVLATGTGAHAGAVRDVALDQRDVVFPRFPFDTVTIEVEGFDDVGTLIAYGKAGATKVASDATIDVAFRRIVAYVTHRQVCGGGCDSRSACVNPGIVATASTGAGPGPAARGAYGPGYACHPTAPSCNPACGAGTACVSVHGTAGCWSMYGGRSPGAGAIYILDVTNRTLVKKVKLPGSAPIAAGVTAEGGDGAVITYSDGSNGFAGVLSSDDGSLASIPLTRPETLAVLGPGKTIGAAAGGGLVSLFDVAARKVTRDVEVGGNVLDAGIGVDGTRAVFIVDVSPGVVLVDLDRPGADDAVKSADVEGATGVAVGEGGRLAYVTSKTGQVSVIDLATAAVTQGSGSGFATGAGVAAFSDRIQAVLAISLGDSGPAPRVVGFDVASSSGYPLAAAVSTLPDPMGIASGPGGARLVVVSAGTTTTTAGLTVIDTEPGQLPEGSSTTYPLDPDDTFTDPSGFVAPERYAPDKIAILYGR